MDITSKIVNGQFPTQFVNIYSTDSSCIKPDLWFWS